MDKLIDGVKPLTTLHRGVSLILLEFTSREGTAGTKCKRGHDRRIDKKLKYTSQFVPTITIAEYIQRISALALLTDEALIAALVYIDRAIARKGLVLTLHEMHR
ncbi:MAG: hypothetical protein P4M11_03780 [Candidatus Pacebacteria bacterium]|nr:hypothetical protein [Candidatus Paceibacterota bacterium]